MKNFIYITFIASLFLIGCETSTTSNSTDTDLANTESDVVATVEESEDDASSETTEVDFTKPESVVNAVFTSASTEDYTILEGLCDPLSENDGDTRRICECASKEDGRAEFINYFKQGKVNGEARINGDEAEVDFFFGPDGTDTETMKLINRDGKWYLYSF